MSSDASTLSIPTLKPCSESLTSFTSLVQHHPMRLFYGSSRSRDRYASYWQSTSQTTRKGEIYRAILVIRNNDQATRFNHAHFIMSSIQSAHVYHTCRTHKEAAASWSFCMCRAYERSVGEEQPPPGVHLGHVRSPLYIDAIKIYILHVLLV
jgi:hypothetical protein